MPKVFWNKKNAIILGSIVAILVLVASVFTIKYFKDCVIDDLNFTIVASNTDKSGIGTNSEFIITSEKDYPLRAIKLATTVSPSTEYSLEKIGTKKYKLIPSAELEDNAIYNIKIKANKNEPELSWAFQTKTTFKVISTLPADKNTYASTNTGIELNFSVPTTDISEYFEIIPKVNGKFEYKDKKIIFIPSTDLNADTPYKVNIKKGFKDINGQELKEDFVFYFRTSSVNGYLSNPYLNITNGLQETFSTKNKKLIGMSSSGDYKDETFIVDIYKFNDVSEYLRAIEEVNTSIMPHVGLLEDYKLKVSKYSKVGTFEQKLQKTSENVWEEILAIPDGIIDTEGWYLADIKTTSTGLRTSGKHLQKLIQISDISVYMKSVNGDTRIWCNDVSDGTPVVGATVGVGKFASLTDKDGIAQFSISSSENQKVLITSKDGKQFAEYFPLTKQEEQLLDDIYYTYLYTDRKTYLPTDTIKFWGRILPKSTTIPMPGKISIVWDKDVPVTVNSDGTFYGEIKFSNHSSDYIVMKIKYDELESYKSNIEILDTIRPVYTLSSTFSKPYYKGNDKLYLKVNGQFYDGTSAEGIKVDVESGKFKKTVTLDNNGESTINFGYEPYDQSGDIHYANAQLKVSGIDEYASSYNSAICFPTDYHVEGNWITTGDKKSILDLSASKIDYSSIDSTNIDYTKIYNGGNIPLKVTANIVKCESIKTKTGEYYDYFEGVTKPQYTYTEQKTPVETINIDVKADGDTKIELPYFPEENIRYEAELMYTFPDGFNGKKIIYLYDNYYYGSMTSCHFDTDKINYATNETIKVNIVKSQKLANESGRFLCMVTRDTIKTIDIKNTQTFDLKFTKDCIPNCVISGAYFDGANVYEITDKYLYFNNKEKEINISIETDKESYKPGDTVKTTITAKDANGNPIEGKFILSVADEAALGKDYKGESPLQSLYVYRDYNSSSFSSFIDHEKFEGGEGGGGGEDGNVRNIFIDTPAFIPLTTDKTGTVETTFTLPDNLTSWRITVAGITKDIMGGIASKNINTSIPFFVNPVVSEKYSASDDVSLTVRSAGTAKMLMSSFVEYEVKLVGETVNKTKKLQLKPSETATFNFGKQPVGKYKITVKATAGNYSDAIEKELTVQNSLQEIPLSKDVELDKISQTKALKYPVKVMLYDKNNMIYYKALNKVLESSYSATADQKTARNIATSKLYTLYGPGEVSNSGLDIVQNYDGGISRVVSSLSDPTVTAKICWAYPDLIDVERTKSYFNNIIAYSESSSASVSAAYLGLAALKSPVLTDIKYLLDNNSGFDVWDNINFISGLVALGDNQGARDYYNKLLKSLAKEENGQIYYAIEGENYFYEGTSKILPILALIRDENLPKVLKYVIENNVKDYSPAIDLCIYLNSYNPTESKASVTYKYDDVTGKVRFDKKTVEVIKLDQYELEDFGVIKINGNVGATLHYVGSIYDAMGISEDKLSIEKTVSNNNKLGEYSAVTLKIKLPETVEKGLYLVSDIIPSSSRPMIDDYSYNEVWGYAGQEGQKITFYLRDASKGTVTINYKIRNVLPGKFAIERAVLTTPKGIVIGYSNATNIEIQ